MSETVVLDPTELDSGRTELDITRWIDAEGADWGDAEITPYVSQSQYGEYLLDYRVPNRTIAIPLSLTTQGTITGPDARARIQAKASLFQRDGGSLRRITNSGGTVYADIVGASFHATSIPGWASRDDVDLEANLTLQVIPDFYGPEVTLSDHTETTLPEITFTESIDGDYPGRVRVVVDEDQGAAQLGLLYSFRSRNYSSAATAKMVYEAESLTPTGVGMVGTALAVAGRSGGTVYNYTTVDESWDPVLKFRLNTGTALTHTGRYAVYASYAQASDNSDLQVRLGYAVGDLTDLTYSNVETMPGMIWPNYGIARLGEVDLRASPIGAHSWSGQIEARVTLAGGAGTIALDRIWLANTDDGFGVVSLDGGTVLHSSQSGEIRTEGYFRAGTAGGSYRQLPIYGDLPRIPAGTATEVMVKTTRGVVGGTVSDSNIDNISARVTYRPSWLFVDDTL